MNQHLDFSFNNIINNTFSQSFIRVIIFSKSKRINDTWGNRAMNDKQRQLSREKKIRDGD